MEQDNSRPATGYPATGYPQPQQSNSNPSGYPNSASGGTAYPYAAPPPQAQYYNQNPYYGQPYPQQRVTFVRRLLGAIIAAFIIAGTILFIVWLVLRPRLPEFRVDSVNVSNFNLSSSLLTGDWDVRFTVRNPNSKITLYYDNIEAWVYYRDASLAVTSVPPFVQPKKNETTAKASFAAASAYLDKRVVDSIARDRTSTRVPFNVRMLARVRFKAHSWPARTRFMRIYCGELPVGINLTSAAGTLVGGASQCKVGL